VTGNPKYLRTSLLRAPSLLALMAGSAFAQQVPQNTASNDPPVVVLDTITVTATRTEIIALDSAASVSIITRDQLDEAQANDLSVLRDIPGVDFGGGARSAGQMPTIRGLQGPRVILSVDGARRNHSDGVRSPLLIDPDMIQQVDVVRGPTSALYGSGGIGGVMSFRTLTADDLLLPGETAAGRARVSYRTGNSEASTNWTAAAQSSGFDVLGSVTWRDVGDIGMGDGNDLDNDDQLQAGLLKAGYSFNDLHRAEVSYQRFGDKLVTPSNPGGNPSFGLVQVLKREQDQYTGTYTFRDADRAWFDGSLNAYYTKLHFETKPYTVGVNETDVNTTTAGFSLQNSSRFEMAPWLHHRVTYGADGYRDRARNLDGGTANLVTPDGDQQAWGLFIQDEIVIADDWTLTGALRQDYYEINPVARASSDNSRLSPKVSLHWQATPNVGVYGGYAEAYRAPTLSETYQNLSRTNALFNFAPNSDLKPETSRTWEGGVILAFDDVLADRDSLQVKVSYFNEKVDDLISSTVIGTYARTAPFGGTGSIFQNQNIAKAKRQGGEAVVSYAVDDIDFGLGYSRLRSKDASTGASLYAPPDKLSLGVKYRLDDAWSAWWSGQFVAAQERDSTLLRQRSGYSLHDLGVAYAQDWYRVDFSVTNLFDKAYATYQQSQLTTFTYEEGRSANLTLTAKF
jgi:hemoglobin/transferrin/lactoferrin receptor protein